jgi:DNA-binding TFAR19-related protein (PDSD5 family)
MKTKTLDEVSIRERLERLKRTNPNMADELETQYMHVLNRRNDDQYLTAKKPLRKKW